MRGVIRLHCEVSRGTWVFEMVNYKIKVKSSAGVLLGEYIDFNWLACTNRVNRPGYLQAEFPDDHEIVGVLENLGQVELWRRNETQGVPWTLEFEGIYRDEPERRRSGKSGAFKLYTPGKLDMLNWRIVAYKAETANRSIFVGQPVETIMKTIVGYNCGANATMVNERLVDGAISGISIEADSGRGLVTDWGCFGDVVLDTLGSLSSLGPGDFDLYKTGAGTWEFRYYPNQLGTDRTASVIFGIKLGNMDDPIYRLDRTDERTVAIVGGRDSGQNRDFVVRTGAGYSAGHHREMFVNASDLSTTDGYQARGDKTLNDYRAKETFSFRIVQSPSCMYGVHYFLGDKVKTVNPFTSSVLTQKVMERIFGVDQMGKESVTIKLEIV